MPAYLPKKEQRSFFRSLTNYTTVAISILLMTTGCDALDAVSGDSIFLSTSRVLCFEFSDLNSGGDKTIVSTE